MKPDASSGASEAIRAESQLVTFLLGEEEFGFGIMSVQEIIRPPKIARVPMAPECVDGIANLRGVVLPIVDTRARFGMPRAPDTDRTRVLVIDNQGVKTGLRVDRVRQVTRVADSEVEPPPDVIQGVSADYLSGVVKLEQGRRIIMALNPARVCNVELKDTLDASSGGHGALGSSALQHESRQDEVEQLVTFTLAREEFAFSMERVREILRVQTPTEVPDTPDYILGVLTVRGQILPILDLRRLLGQESMVDEMCRKVREHQKSYHAGIDTLRAAAQSHGPSQAEFGYLETAKIALNAINSSSQILMESLAKIRGANDKALRLAQAHKDPELSPEQRTQMAQEVLGASAQVLEGLGNLEQQIRDNIQDDQRIIVVDAQGVLLGLVVDHVNEVLNVAKDLIDPPPIIGNVKDSALSGIAKLNDGARLIILLDTAKLLRDQKLRQLGSPANDPVGEKMRDGSETKAAQGAESDDLQLITFRLGEEEFGIPISHIQEIDRHSKITRVPTAPSFVEGITNLRGEVIPVIDTRKRFGMEVKTADDRTRIIIVDMGGTKTGFLVDSVSQVLNLAVRDIAPPPRTIASGVNSDFISGIGSKDDGKRMIVLLDVEKILSTQEQQALGAMVPAPRADRLAS